MAEPMADFPFLEPIEIFDEEDLEEMEELEEIEGLEELERYREMVKVCGDAEISEQPAEQPTVSLAMPDYVAITMTETSVSCAHHVRPENLEAMILVLKGILESITEGPDESDTIH